ncbi:MAG: TetR/AcrR family transcriptional regulator [Aquabacterium sp.]
MTDTPTRRRRKEARPQELLEAALALFVEKGFAATRAEEVATRAGVSKGTLYLYFPSKEDLLKAVIAHFLSARIAGVAQEVTRHQGPTEDLARGLLVQWWREVVTSPASGVFKLIISEVRNFPELARYYNEEVIDVGHALLAQLIQRGIDRGEFRPVPVDSTVHSLVLPFVMCCLHQHSLGACAGHHELDVERFVSEHVDLVLAGLRPTAPPAARRPKAPTPSPAQGRRVARTPARDA